MLIRFDEKTHKYYDDNGDIFTSVTTKLKSLTNTFDAEKQAKVCARIGADPSHPSYLRYRNMSSEMLLEKWRLQNAVACEQGTNTHMWLENTIKSCCSYNQYNLVPRAYKNELIGLDKICKLNLKPNILLKKNNIKKLMINAPEIYYGIVEHYVNKSTLFQEVLVYDVFSRIAGQIDQIAINQKDKTFKIDDWKTNNAPIRKESGYFKKNDLGEITDVFVPKWLFMHPPLSHLADSKFNHYALQLSLYAMLVEMMTGYTCEGLKIYHIRNAAQIALIYEIDVYDVPYMKHECNLLLNYSYGN